MPNQSSFFASGKLYLAGEYAVTAPGGEALIMPVKKGIKVTVVARKKLAIINRQYPEESKSFELIGDLHNPYLRLAIEVVRQLISYQNISWRNFALTIDSTIASKEGKYGLGSSAAITVAVIGALLKFFGIKTQPETIYRLAVIATIHNYQDTSFGDVACSSAGQLIHYRKFDASMLPLIKTMSVKTLLSIPWDGLLIKPVPNFKLIPEVIFSGTSASSHQLVKKVTPFLKQSWVIQSNQYVNQMMTTQNPKVIDQLNAHLLQIDHKSGANLFTTAIQNLITIARDHQGYAKFSGAGGGDSVVAFIPSQYLSKFRLAIKKAKYLLLHDII